MLGPIGDAEGELEAIASRLGDRLAAAVRRHELGDALGAVWELVRGTNRYLELTQPWRLRAATGSARALGTSLASAAGALRVLGPAVAPFLPELGQRLAAAFGVSLVPGVLGRTSALRGLPVGQELAPPAVLAPRLRPRRP